MDDYKIRPRSEVEELVTKFIVDNKIHAPVSYTHLTLPTKA